MAKRKPSMTGLFTKTESQAADAPRDKIEPRSIGLKQSEWVVFDRIARELGKKPHAVRAYALRYFLKAWQDGKIKTEKKTTQDLPGL